jgi:hypothetical protein
VHPHVGGVVQVGGVETALALAAPPDLEQELSVARELEQEVLLALAQARPASRGDPHVAFVVHVDAVLVGGPLVGVVLGRAAPSAQVVAGRVEFQHWRRRGAALGLGILLQFVAVQRPRPLQHPHVVLRVNGHPGNLPENPLLRQLRPERIDLKARRLGLRSGGVTIDRGRTSGEDCDEAERREQASRARGSDTERHASG